MNRAATHASAPYVFGGYELIEMTGAGGMGVVYQAFDLALGRTVAIKVLKDEFQAQPQLVARFRREAEAIGTLNHPNIVRVYAVGETANIPFIAMEFVEGRPLSEMLEESGSLPWEEVLDIAVQVADALASAHDCQVIHRDIKPANILVMQDGRVKVTDFGIAKILNASTQLTADGARIGTPQYMCPERCKNLPITASSDIYSLGVLLYQCITGRLPFEARNSASLVTKIASEIPPRIREFKPDVPDAVDRLVAYLLEKEARHRPRDARTLKEMIERVRRGEPLAPDTSGGLREALAACTVRPEPEVRPATASDLSTTRLRPGLASRLRDQWFSCSRWIRIAVALGLLALLGAFAWAVLRAVAQQAASARASLPPPQDLSRWEDGLELAAFRQETGQVFLADVQLPDFAVHDLVWASGADGAVVLLQGLSGTPRDGQWAIVTLNPYLREANVARAPFAAGESRLLSSAIQDGRGPGFIVSVDGASWRQQIRPGVAPDPLASGNCYLGGSDPAGQIVLLAQQAAGGGVHRVIRLDASMPGNSGTTFPIPGAVRALAVHAASARVAMLHEDGATTNLGVLNVSTGVFEAESLARGSLRLNPRAFNDAGTALAYTEESGGGATIRVASLGGVSTPADAGPGREAAWVEHHGYLLATAPDHAGRLQLWAVEATAPHARRQLTHIDSGIDGPFVLAEDGNMALAAISGRAALLCVELETIAW